MGKYKRTALGTLVERTNLRYNSRAVLDYKKPDEVINQFVGLKA